MRSPCSRETALKESLRISNRRSVPLHPAGPRKDEPGKLLVPVRKPAMDVHLLVTAGDECRPSAVADFISTFFTHKAALRFTLFAAFMRGTSNGVGLKKGRSARPGPVHRVRVKLDAMRELLSHSGIREEGIRNKILDRRRATVNDLLREAASVHYDAVLLRKDSRSLRDEFFSLCLSRKILNQGLGAPVWICQPAEPGRQNVLFCVDETCASVRMAGYIGSMLRDEPQHRVTIFHVDTGKRSNVPEIMERARRGIIEGGTPEDRIVTLVKPSRRIIGSIREEAMAGAYAVAAFGHEPGEAKAWFPGSRCLTILETIEECTLWVGR